MDQRILTISEKNHKGKVVLYVMSRDQRVFDNHALLAAQNHADEHNVPLLVSFNLVPSSGVRAKEHYEFMLDGLLEVEVSLKTLDIPLIVTCGNPNETIVEVIDHLDPLAVYFDFSPLKNARVLIKNVAQRHEGSTYVVDAHNIIPTWVTSKKQEFAAHTIRSKIHVHLERFMVEPAKPKKQVVTYTETLPGITLAHARERISAPRRNISIAATSGSRAAHDHLRFFIDDSLADYALARNNIANDRQSGLSPYLHFGQISSLRVALEVLYSVNERPLLFDQAKMAQSGSVASTQDGMNALFEEMIVRKELSDNFCLHASSYITIDGAHDWAKVTLQEHANDPRQFLYTIEELESANTHDDAWNAAQTQLTRSGKMHGYMRMYWAKKILEWSSDAQSALDHTIYLNDAYSIDGGDPNGYVGILWSIAGVHDRPWAERSVFGKIRYMNQAGLRRKFDLDAYIQQWIG